MTKDHTYANYLPGNFEHAWQNNFLIEMFAKRTKLALSFEKKERNELFVDFSRYETLFAKTRLLRKHFNEIIISNLGPK